MNRRTFLKTGAALPTAAAVSGLPRFAFADAQGGSAWRVFEVTSQIEVLQPAGATRVWLPVPLTRDTDYFKSLGNSWTAMGGNAAFVQDKKYGAGIVSAEFTDSVAKPALQLVSRFATRDRAVDLSKPARRVVEDRSVLNLSLESTDLIPTDGIVRDTARSVTKWQWNNVDKARAIYDWVVENTFRDPKVRGCGWGDIKTMLETRNMGGKCGDLNELFVGMARAAGVPDFSGILGASNSANGT